MKKIIITESQFKSVLNELFPQSLIKKLIEKFKVENPELEERVIKYHIQRFEQIKDSPNVKEKDINKYSWDELEYVIGMNPAQGIKTNIHITDSDLIYNQNNLKIYQSLSKEACVKYGNGYNFCISARSEENMYDEYRIKNRFTIYFVHDLDKSTERQTDNKFVDPLHLIIIMVREPDPDEWTDGTEEDISKINIPKLEYQVTTANNDGEKMYYTFNNLVKIQPKLNGLEELFHIVEPTKKEQGLYDLNHKVIADLARVEYYLFHPKTFADYRVGTIDEINPKSINTVYNIIKGKPIYLYLSGIKGYTPTYIGFRFEKLTKDEWYKEKEYNTDPEKYDFTVLEGEFSHAYLKYINEVWKVIRNYLRQKTLLNINET